MLVGGIVLAGVPAKQHSLRGGLLAINAQVVLVASILPLLPGLAAASALLPSGRRRKLRAMLATSVLVAVPVFLARLIAYGEDKLPDTAMLSARLPLWMALVPIAAFAGTGLLWRWRTRSLLLSLLVVCLAALGIAWLPVVTLDGLAAYSAYLAYHIGQPRLKPAFSLPLLAAAGVFVVAGAALLSLRRAADGGVARGVRHAIAVVAVALAALFFVRFSVVPATQHSVHALISVDRTSGRIAWTSEGLRGGGGVIDRRNTAATPTPVTDGERVCAYFGDPGIFCTDPAGRVLWSRTDVGYRSYYGVGFSPVLRDGRLVLAAEEPGGRARVRAFDVRSGREIWSREYRVSPAISGNSRTAIVEEDDDGTSTVLVWGVDALRALALHTGAERWHYPVKSGGDLVSSVVSDAERVYLSSAAGTLALDKAKVATAAEPVVWRTSKARSNCVSPVLCGGLLFTVSDAGIVTAVDAETGTVRWRHRLEGQFFSSPISTERAAYLTSAEGRTTVFACEPAARVLSENELGVKTIASPAAANGQIFLRAGGALLAIADRR